MRLNYRKIRRNNWYSKRNHIIGVCECVVYQSLIEIMSNCNPNINWNINHRVVCVSQNREIYCEIKTFRQNHPKFSAKEPDCERQQIFFFGERSININVHRSKTTLSRESNEYAHTHTHTQHH